MKKTVVITAALAVVGLFSSTFAAQPDSAQLQQVYEKAYQDLASERHSCQPQACPAIPSEKVEQIFNNAYVQIVGAQPRYEEFLAWKYNSNFPSTIASDTRFPQTAQMAPSGTAAVRNLPEKTTQRHNLYRKTKTTTKVHCKK